MSATNSQPCPLFRTYFLPLMSPGHMIPMLDIAKLFSLRNVAATIITTPRNEPLVRLTIDNFNATAAPSQPIELTIVNFPDSVTHLIPKSGENLGSISFAENTSFLYAVFALGGPIQSLLQRERPDCFVMDAWFYWISDITAELGIPHLVFSGHGCFPLCVHRSLLLHRTHESVSSDNEPFVVPGLPDQIELTKSEVSPIFQYPEVLEAQRRSEEKSYGVIVNTFRELEPAYAAYFCEEPKTNAWFVGPVSLCDLGNNTDRGGEAAHELDNWLHWLDSKPAASVIYICFGSLCELSAEQLKAIALGLEASGHPFFWVVRGGPAGAPENFKEWLPERFEERVKGRGVVVRGWAPQVVLLGHPAVGAFFTHCGWNSTLEGVTAGKPIVTMPLMYEQFVNEKLLVEVVRIGVRVRRGGAVEEVTDGEVAAAIEEVMGSGEEAMERRKRAREYGEMAKAAMEKGGSSCEDMNGLVEGLARKFASG